MDFLSLLLGQVFDSDDENAAQSKRIERHVRRAADVVQRWRNDPAQRGKGAVQRLALFPGLHAAFEEAVRRADGDRRRVWLVRALSFDSHVETRRCFLTGGAYAPAFLTREPDHLGWPNLPGAHLRQARLILARSLDSAPADWAPFLKAVKEEGESLAVIAENLRQDLLATLAMNAARGTLRLCVLHPGDLKPSLDELAQALATSENHATLLAPDQAPEKSLRKRLPRVNVIARRDAAVIEPIEEDDDNAKKTTTALPLTETAWISVGGDDLHDQQNRLLALYDALACDAPSLAPS